MYIENDLKLLLLGHFFVFLFLIIFFIQSYSRKAAEALESRKKKNSFLHVRDEFFGVVFVLLRTCGDRNGFLNHVH